PLVDLCQVIPPYAQSFHATGYFVGSQQWVGCQSGPPIAGVSVLANYALGLGSDDFARVELLTRAGSRLQTTVEIVPEPFGLIMTAVLGWAWIRFRGISRR
ncbi:MAG TPA: hypothetical protein VIY86_07835, partial [Pirellulaceae bacterium]